MPTLPAFAPSFAAHPYAARPAPQPARPFAAQQPAPQSLPARPSLAQQPAPPRPTIRAQAPDEPAPPARPALADVRPAPLRLPAPEALGIICSKPPAGEAPDWAAAHRRLDRLGATCFHLDRAPQGGCRITCLLPTRDPGRTHRVESRAATEAEALRLALERAEAWAAGK